MNTLVIYKITHAPSGRVYVGSTKKFTRRRQQHLWDLKKRVHVNRHLQAAYDADPDPAHLTFEIVEVVTSALALAREQYWLDRYRGTAFNLAPEAGSLRGYKRSPETRTRMAAAAKLRGMPRATILAGAAAAKAKSAGKPRPPEVGKKISAAKMGHAVSDETREKIREKRMAFWDTPRGDELRARIANAQRRPRSVESNTKRSIALKAYWEKKRAHA